LSLGLAVTTHHFSSPTDKSVSTSNVSGNDATGIWLTATTSPVSAFKIVTSTAFLPKPNITARPPERP
jgi:hypothetical protein